MSTAKAVMGRLLGRLLFTPCRVGGVAELSPGFRKLELAGEKLRAVRWTPGDKLQVFIDGDFRTYTPTCWDAAEGSTTLVAYVHGAGPGARWASGVKAGDAVELFGPRGSVRLERGPAVLFGDETSFGTAVALGGAAPGLWSLFEVNDVHASRAALAALGIEGELVARAGDGDAHLPGLAAKLEARLRRAPDGQLVMTGRARSIQRVRKLLREAQVSSSTRAKAHWADGKRGLD